MNVQVSTVVMMLVLGSLALIGVGVSILIDDNIRIGLVKDYKEKYEAFAVQKGRFRRTRFEADIGAGNRVPLERFEGQENIGGFTGDLPSPKADTFGWSALLPATESWTIYQFVDDAPPAAGASFVVPRLSVAVPSSNQLVCTPDNFDRQTGTCPDDFLQRMCHEISGDDSVGTVNKDPAITGECPRDNVICGTCDFNYYLNTRVEYVVWSGASENRWRMAANLGWPEYPQGRRYPFNLSDQEFTFEFKNPMNFTLKPIGDPYSVAQNLTEGAMDFGETLDDQRRTGLIMIATGSITFLICTGAMAAMRYMTVKANQQREAAAKEAAQGLNANGNANANDPNAAAGAAAAGGGAAVAQANNPNPQLQQQAANNDGSGGWNGNQQNQQQQQGQQQGQQGQGGNNSGWGNANNGGQNNNGGGGGWGNPAQGGGQQNPMNQFNNNNGNNNGNGNGDGWGNQDDADFRAVGPGAMGIATTATVVAAAAAAAVAVNTEGTDRAVARMVVATRTTAVRATVAAAATAVGAEAATTLLAAAGRAAAGSSHTTTRVRNARAAPAPRRSPKRCGVAPATAVRPRVRRAGAATAATPVVVATNASKMTRICSRCVVSSTLPSSTHVAASPQV
eukprot:CAMPEP_0174835458 /NCGR_PEP_ID=MMETSP1114-20130205/5418_1 /TAXON_ID=312471 /ORGANISM="Neobodo designis, Strain CCAP 1951/1" /LENGTH=621 /DNA_ID=CAMNT_0016069407 /DNA_START=188 /DNA_END=2050 /DNA_ORIENTATION=+